MNPDFNDPCNHVPEVSPGDVWGDVEGLGGMTRLPPKRVAQEEIPNPRGGLRNGGVCIESTVPAVRGHQPDERLEVQEIDGSVVRLTPEDPGQPWAERQVVFHERPAGGKGRGRHHGELHEWGATHRQSARWLLGGGLAVLLLVVAAMMLLPAVNQSNAARPEQIQNLVIDPVEPVPEMDRFQDLFARQAEAEQIFRAYAAARIAADVLPLVRDAPAVRTLILNRFRPLDVPRGWQPPSDNEWIIAGEGGRVFGVLEGPLPDFSKFCAYFIEEGDGVLRLDWKATTGFGTAGFDELQAGHGDASEIRGTVFPVAFFNAVFPEDAFRSYQLVAPDREQAIWVYTRLGEPVDAEIGRWFEEGTILAAPSEPIKVTLRLKRGPAEALPAQWLIEEMLHKDWIKR